MSAGQKVTLGAVVALVAVVTATLLLSVRRRPITLMGAVLRQDAAAGKQAPIAGVKITVEAAAPGLSTQSDAAGYFNVTLPLTIHRRQPLTLHLRQSDYQPLDATISAGNQLYVFRMTPIRQSPVSTEGHPLINVANVSIRYAVRSEASVDVGSAVKTIAVINTGNIPCAGEPLCSPDGKWRAAVATASLDAGVGQEFRNPRVSCIAGPCPFTHVDELTLDEGNRIVHVSVRDWSDTVTFVLEAEVFREMGDSIVRHSYPVIFDRTMSFTLPAEAEGPSIEAEIAGETIVFPLGPELCLSWANCTARSDPDHSQVYRCQLNAGYRFY
jgi:hypothetical protein